MITDRITRKFLDMIILLGDKVDSNLVVYFVDNMSLTFAKIHLTNPQHGLDLFEGRSLVIWLHKEKGSRLQNKKNMWNNNIMTATRDFVETPC